MMKLPQKNERGQHVIGVMTRRILCCVGLLSEELSPLCVVCGLIGGAELFEADTCLKFLHRKIKFHIHAAMIHDTLLL